MKEVRLRPSTISSIFGVLIMLAAGCYRPSTTRSFPSEIQKGLLELHHLEQYKAQKNSFVLGLESICLRPPAIPKNGRKTILDVQGTGSLRHIWETHGPGKSPFILEFYVDGEAEPSIKGPFDQLVEAAKSSSQPFISIGGTTVDYDSYNFYLPVPFEESLKIDLIANPKIGMVFLQLDYRLEDESMKGIRLVQDNNGKNGEIKLAYIPGQSLDSQTAYEMPKTKNKRCRFSGDGTIRIDGPAIIRRLGVNAKREGVRMLIRFDGEESAAVNVDMADFFGPFRGVAMNNNQCYFPMPFRNTAEIEILGGRPTEEWQIEMDIEQLNDFEPEWGYFHALFTRVDSSVAFLPLQVLSTKGKGKWIGMSVYDTHHDHGGGDFAIIDANTPYPSFLHGINGEDYFSFAFFGKGENFPYSEAFDNDEGRMRVHFENAYPFEESITVNWGVTGGLSPRSVAFWYQDTPEDRTMTEIETRGRMWDVFGPVSVKTLLDDGNTVDVSDLDRTFEVLPDPEDLDGGMPVEAEHIVFHKELKGTFFGWAKQYASGPHLNLMYVYGHVMPDLGASHHMGYYARCVMARTFISSDKAKQVTLQLSFDDPLQVFLNGEQIYATAQLSDGFITEKIQTDLIAGENSLLIKLLDTPNNNTMWAGISLRILEE